MNNNSAIIIKKGKEKEFFDELIKNKPTFEYWEECKQKEISDETMEKIKNICNNK